MVAIFVVIILCQIVVSVPICKRLSDNIVPKRLSIQLSDTDDITIKFTTDNNEELYKANGLPDLNLPDPSSLPELPELPELPSFSNAWSATVEFITNTWNAIVEFITEHLSLIIGIVIVVLLLLFPSFFVCLVRSIGFTMEGITKGSWAAVIMASYCGKIAVGSAVSVLQSIGAAGISGLKGLFKLIG